MFIDIFSLKMGTKSIMSLNFNYAIDLMVFIRKSISKDVSVTKNTSIIHVLNKLAFLVFDILRFKLVIVYFSSHRIYLRPHIVMIIPH